MKIELASVRRLRKLTGVGITDAKQALEASKGDFDQALDAMRVKGLAKADQREHRSVKAGLVHSYVHSERIGVLVEVNCETDFVARNREFKEFVHNLTLHIAASSPLYIDKASIPKDVLKKEKDLITQSSQVQDSGKTPSQLKSIIQGRLDKFVDSVCLLKQPYVKDPEQTVSEYVKQHIAKLGENISVHRFVRIEFGRDD